MLNLLMNASTRRFSSSCPSDGSRRTGAAGAGALLRPSLNVSAFRIAAGGAAGSTSPLPEGRRPGRVSQVSDFLRGRCNGGPRPSVMAFHVLSSVSSFRGRATRRALLPSGVGLAAFRLNLADTSGFSLEFVRSANGATSFSASASTSGSAPLSRGVHVDLEIENSSSSSCSGAGAAAFTFTTGLSTATASTARTATTGAGTCKGAAGSTAPCSGSSISAAEAS
uniref:Uncharacterized protein n=1 Tax=Arundo donax TaxID=35708 RepID=A0A0A9E1U7_ARUDO